MSRCVEAPICCRQFSCRIFVGKVRPTLCDDNLASVGYPVARSPPLGDEPHHRHEVAKAASTMSMRFIVSLGCGCEFDGGIGFLFVWRQAGEGPWVLGQGRGPGRASRHRRPAATLLAQPWSPRSAWSAAPQARAPRRKQGSRRRPCRCHRPCSSCYQPCLLPHTPQW